MLKKFTPVTTAQRQLVQIDRSSLFKGRPLKSLTVSQSSTGGRNNFGRITCRHKGGGHKKLYRVIDFKRSINSELEVERIEYDPNRSGFIALVRNIENACYSYVIAPEGLKIGDRIFNGGEGTDIKIANCLALRYIPVGTTIHNVEMKVGKGAQLVRSAGASAQIVGKDNLYAQVKLQSGEVRMILLDCRATIGVVSNFDHKNTSIGKAGRSRWKGVRPTVRGVAMNPVDHPHGGGEGKTSGGRHPVSPKGKPTKGKKTRRNKSTSKFIIKKRKVGR
jgi:large subunit ribosomal protein L2